MGRTPGNWRKACLAHPCPDCLPVPGPRTQAAWSPAGPSGGPQAGVTPPAQGRGPNCLVIKGSFNICKTPGRDGEGGRAGRETPGAALPQGWQKAQSLPAGRHKSPFPGAAWDLRVPAAPARFSSGKESCERPMKEQVGRAAPGHEPGGAG